MSENQKQDNLNTYSEPTIKEHEIILDGPDSSGAELFVKITGSLAMLEEAVAVARMKFTAHPLVPQSIFERLNSYEEMLNKQRALAYELVDHLATGKKAEVSRCMGVINALSSFIGEDAKSIVAALGQLEEEGAGKVYYC